MIDKKKLLEKISGMITGARQHNAKCSKESCDKVCKGNCAKKCDEDSNNMKYDDEKKFVYKNESMKCDLPDEAFSWREANYRISIKILYSSGEIIVDVVKLVSDAKSVSCDFFQNLISNFIEPMVMSKIACCLYEKENAKKYKKLLTTGDSGKKRAFFAGVQFKKNS